MLRHLALGEAGRRARVSSDLAGTGAPLSEHARRAARAYGAAADHYGGDALSFWDRFGAATVSRLGLAPGGAVLDLCCGAGASAIPAARAVGPAGRLLGVDVAAPLLDLARARATAEALANLEFRHEDATCTGLPDGAFDAVVCVFGVFFAPDMAAFVQEMWRLVRPGGVLAITTWGPGLFEPASSHSWRCVGEVLATSLFGDVAAALREHVSATLDEHCCYFRRPDCVLVGAHRDLRSRGITDCPVTAMTVTRCDGRDSTDVRYPPLCRAALESPRRRCRTQIWMFCAPPPCS